VGFGENQGSSTPAPPQISMTTYVVGVIRKGPTWGTGTPAERQRIQDGHLANIRRMTQTGKLVVAGPFESEELRGLFIFGVSSTAEAQELLKDDPAVAAGRLAVDLYQWYAPPGLSVVTQGASKLAGQ
jgi:uncharacterized protein YciI